MPLADEREPNKIFLLPGESTFVRKKTLISTLLGSCVAVCLYDKEKHWGGMNHYMLPYKEDGTLPPGKYGDTSIDALLKVANVAGSDKGDLIASIYGGASVIGHLGHDENTGVLSVSKRNVEVAKKRLHLHGVRLAYQEVGGTHGRRIYMDSETNKIECKEIEASRDAKAREAQRNRLKGRDIGVLVIDDSSTVRKLITSGIEAADGIHVTGEAADPYEARELILDSDPDVLCLDIIMPRLDGLSFLKKIMQYKPIPTVIVSTIAKRGSEMEANVKEAGAVDVVDKEDLELYKSKDIVQKVLVPKLMSAAQTIVRKRMPEAG